MNRKQRRQLNKMVGKEAASTIDLMTDMPKQCSVCQKPFDKQDREMVQSWFVDVFNSQKLVILTCPECRTGDIGK